MENRTTQPSIEQEPAEQYADEQPSQEQHSGEKRADYGTIKIADDVIATIAGIAAMDIKGVAGMAGGVTSGITEMLGKKNMTKGVKVVVNDQDVAIDLFLVVVFGTRIPALANEIQNKVRQALENMTGLKVHEVNVHVQGVTFDVMELKEKDDKPTL